MKSIKKHILLFFLSCIGGTIAAQTIDVSAKIDSSSMLIGEQRHIRLEVIQPQSAEVRFPIIGHTDTLVPGVEILAISNLDTIPADGVRLKISQDILITSFDTGKYVIPPFKFTTRTKEYECPRIYLQVSTIEADFEKAQITDIAENYDPGVNIKRIFLYLSILLILACLGYIGYILFNYYMRMKAIQTETEEKIDPRLPHEVALEELNEIKEEKVWKKGFTKQYYTNITDTLREYFVKRFNISAKEMTSAEIIDSLKYNSDASPILDNMKQIFSTSDMVKFAKQEPSQEENELSILNAYRIVNETILIPKENIPEGNTDNNEINNKNLKIEQ